MHSEVGHKFVGQHVVGALFSYPWESGDEFFRGLGSGGVVDAVPVRKSTSESGGSRRWRRRAAKVDLGTAQCVPSTYSSSKFNASAGSPLLIPLKACTEHPTPQKSNRFMDASSRT